MDFNTGFHGFGCGIAWIWMWHCMDLDAVSWVWILAFHGFGVTVVHGLDSKN
jgi:hypothetical protein